MSEFEAIQQALGAAATRRRWQRAVNGLGRGLLAGAILWLIAVGLFKVFPIPRVVVTGAAWAGVLLTAAFFIDGWRRKPTLTETARWIDSRQRLKERLSTALEFGGSGGDESWRTLLVTDAARFAKGVDARKLIPFHLSSSTKWAVAALAVCAGLGFVPEWRTKAYIEQQADAAIIKDAGKQVVALTKHSLETKPPALEQTKHALQSAEEAGLRLDQKALTRNDALKDLANVTDKLKQQLKELGQQTPALKAMEKAAREPSASSPTGSDAMQKEMDSLQKSLGAAADKQGEIDKLNEELQKAQQSMSSMPKGDSKDAKAARDQMAKTLSDIANQAKQMGQPMPDLEKAISELQNNQTDLFQKDLGQATQDMEKIDQMAKSLQQLQEQAQREGKDLPEQLKFGQAQSAQQSLDKMRNQLNSGQMDSPQMAKMLDEVTRSISPASQYADAAKFMKQASDQLKSGNKADAAKSLAQARDEIQKVMSQMDDAKSLAASIDALNRAEQAIATHTSFGQCNNPGAGKKFGQPHAGHGVGGGGVGDWTDDDSQLFPQQSGLWDNSGVNRKDRDARGQTDRGDPQLSDNLSPTRLHGQMSPGGPMPSINLKGVSIKGQSSVDYQQEAAAAQSDAQNALNQDQVPRAYQGAVKDYFDDLKK